jgi:hypothetical protein
LLCRFVFALAATCASDKIVDAVIHRGARRGRQFFPPLAYHNPAMPPPH